ncbi:TonB-dependent receptor [Sphingosinicella sp. LHD-64]|uniref:TonB-dependent receptor family protein n=1 Tax=Sphingosinicella sp. LHD-64 TaxID=3072139 RepID=UPI00280F4C20|nr:TonB-dependent receptor [Sphingosinicella sp. LHD-64]MDQ8755635.1 TonB-dependent receptor [Sphingosinicella sp. LHD-64]
MLISLAAGASLYVFASTAAVEAAPDDNAIVVTGQHIAEAEADADRRPGGADIVPATDYENRVAVSLRDALAFSPGVYAQPRFGQEVRLSIRGSGLSRGYHMRGLTLLEDGVPINLADDNGDFQELDPTVFQHIEVYRGANALRFGGTTLGGGINGVTPTGRSAPGFAFRLDGGSFDTLRGLVGYGFANEVGDAWVALTGDASDGDRDHARRRSLRFHGNVGLRLSGTVETRFYASAQTLRQELPGALNLADAIERPRTGNFTGDQARDIDSLRLQNRTRITLGGGELEVGGFANLKELYHPIFQLVDQSSTDWGLFSRLDLAHGPFDFTLGSTARFGTVRSRRYVNLSGERGARTFEADQRARTIDVYGEGRYRLGRVSLIAGGVYSHGSREQDQILPTSVNGGFEDDQFSPRFGLLWEPCEAIQLYANYSRSHEMPGFIELAQVAAFVPLDTQRAWTAELGARGRIGIARFDLSLYRATLKGELLQFTVGPDIPASTFNADRTRHQGIEAGLDLDLAPWARLRQIYQYNDFRFRDDAQYGDNRLPVAPKHLYRAELRLGTDALNLAPAVEWVPQGAWADYANTLRVDGYATLGLTAEAALRDGLSLFVDARNLTGTDAVGDISAVVAANPASVIFYPVERRALFGGLRAQF